MSKKRNGEPPPPEKPARSAKPAKPLSMDRWRVSDPDAKFRLAAIDPASKPFSSGDKLTDQQQVEALAVELDQLQDMFFADRRFKLLVVLQGTDTSGKDGTLRGVFGRMSPLGVRAVAWKAPSEAERAHDFLWRIHQQAPGVGEIVVFNRSHYEDVLVPWVKGQVNDAQLKQRYAHINEFERLLCDSGTVVLKFMLHISKDEQRERLQARIDDPTKRYKFQREDIEVRLHWDAYQQGYERMIRATGAPRAPWIIVPADSKTHRNLMIGLALRDALLALKLRYPDPDPSLATLKVE